jgi:hypothetical protein
MTVSVGVEVAADSIRAVVRGRGSQGQGDRLRVPVSVAVTAAGEPLLESIHPGPAARAGAYRDFVERVGDPVPVIGTDGVPRLGADLLALTVAAVVWRATLGVEPDTLVIAHPATWGRYEMSVLRSALSTTWLDSVPTSLVSAPVAAAVSAEEAGAAGPGDALLVADIGGGSTELAVLLGGAGRARRVAATGSTDELGDTVLDRRLAARLAADLAGRFPELDPRAPAHPPALRELVAVARRARAALVRNPSAEVEVRLPSGHDRVRVVRDEFESLVTDAVSAGASSVTRLLREANSNGVTVAAILVTGESADTPLLTEMLSTRTDIPLLIAPDPEWTTANGAVATAAATGAVVAPAVGRPTVQPRHLAGPVPRSARVPVPVAGLTPAPQRAEAPAPTRQTIGAAPGPRPALAGADERRGERQAGTRRPSLRTALAGAAAGLAVLVAGTAIGQAGDAGPVGHVALGSRAHR